MSLIEIHRQSFFRLSLLLMTLTYCYILWFVKQIYFMGAFSLIGPPGRFKSRAAQK